MHHENIEWRVFHALRDVPQPVIDFLKLSPQGSLYQAPDWNDAVENMDGRSLVICAATRGEPLFGALVLKSGIPGTPYFRGMVRWGPVFETAEAAVSLWADFERRLIREGAIALMVFPYWEGEALESLASHLAACAYKPIASKGIYRHTATVDLSGSEEEIFGRLPPAGRSEVRRAVRRGVAVRAANGPEDWHVLWEISHEISRRKGLPGPSRKKVQAMRDFSLAHPGQCVCMISYADGAPVGATAALRHGSRVIPEVGGVYGMPTPGVPKSIPVLWELIRWARETGAAIFDLGGITPEGSNGSEFESIDRFKRKLSRTEETLFTPMEKVFHPSAFRLYRVLRGTKQRFFQKFQMTLS
jgi:lipid II:glycine glycyltransferase (peptidoglycan interpeptide bridge formation enzyme)